MRWLVLFIMLLFIGCQPAEEEPFCGQVCLDKKLMQAAIDDDNPSGCNPIQTDAIRQECRDQFSGYDANCDERCRERQEFDEGLQDMDISSCRGLLNEKSCIDNVNLRLAMQNKDSTYCDKIVDGDLSKDCRNNCCGGLG